MLMVSFIFTVGTLPAKSLRNVRPGTVYNSWRYNDVTMSVDSKLKTIYGCSRNSSRPYTSNQNKGISVRLRNSVHKANKSVNSMRLSEEKPLKRDQEQRDYNIAKDLLFSKIDDYIRKINTGETIH